MSFAEALRAAPASAKAERFDRALLLMFILFGRGMDGRSSLHEQFRKRRPLGELFDELKIILFETILNNHMVFPGFTGGNGEN